MGRRPRPIGRYRPLLAVQTKDKAMTAGH
jgi:hypothetical protein